MAKNATRNEITMPTESERRASEQSRLEDFIHSSVSTFWEIDSDLRFTFYSDRDSLDGGAGPSSFVMHKTLEELLGDEAGSEPWLSHLDDLAARRPFFGADGEFKGYRGVTHDITELEEARRANAWNANHDALTRLSNRRFWNSELPKSSREGAVLMLDMDKFKAINDTLGHDVGDRLLQHVGDVLRASVRDNDVVARLGGDEFAILIRRTISRRQAAIIAQRILKALDRPIVLQGCTVHTSMSIGISVWASQADRLQEQVTLADGALYAAKKNGRNAYVISDKDERLPEALSA